MERNLIFDYLNLNDLLNKEPNFHSSGVWECYTPYSDYTLKDNGFKIHISATLQNVKLILNEVVPVLFKYDVKFKLIRNTKHLNYLNTGYYGYSQIGKMCTIYPKSNAQLLSLLEELYQVTKSFRSISIPSDFVYKKSSVVHYRYGELVTVKKENNDFVDNRERIIPDFVDIPIEDYFIPRRNEINNTFSLLKCLRARGKSAVYLAVDKEKKNLVILKSGQLLGETNIYGYDGLDKVWNEYVSIKELQNLNIYPKPIDILYLTDSLILVQEFFQGETLDKLLEDQPNVIAKSHINKIFDHIIAIHEKKFIVNDLSPDNILINNSAVYFIDAEYVIEEKKFQNYHAEIGTPGFINNKYMGYDKDIYAFLCLLYFIVCPVEYRNLKVKNISNFSKSGNFFLDQVTIDLHEILAEDEEKFFSLGYSEKVNKIKNLINQI